ncbi:hypothetical protein A4A49_13251 [Nicotiana attenuata]|uniref:Uncharacterized protein n=1 Tax=Nicotiana attenuata TaxID=49451 RepID=A0A314LAQ2_NICAT|nr:hypothetical protein A4A49_13251 [Nicotiana attenuata]
MNATLWRLISCPDLSRSNNCLIVTTVVCQVLITCDNCDQILAVNKCDQILAVNRSQYITESDYMIEE